MRTKAKAALISTAAIVGVAGGIWFSWCRGIDYEKRYKDLFDKTFKGDYKITVTESGFDIDDETPIKLPVRYKIYDIEYKDKNGNTRNFKLDSREGYQSYSGIDESAVEYIKNRNIKADYFMMQAIILEMDEIVNDDISENIMPNYFEFEQTNGFSIMFKAECDGYTIICMPFDLRVNYIGELYNNNDKVKEFLSPENCPVLSDMDMKTAANISTYMLNFQLSITDKSKFEMKDEYIKKVEDMLDGYAAVSEYGGNYRYIVNMIGDDTDSIAPMKPGASNNANKVIDQTAAYVISGEKYTFDGNDAKEDRKFKDMIVEKAGYVISEK
jgi:hypothetical protein